MEWKTFVWALLILALLLLAIPFEIVHDDDDVEDTRLFEAYVDKYGKPYKTDPAEYEKRFYRFQQSLRSIEKLNKLRSSPYSAVYGTTNFSDMTEEEFLNNHLRPDLPLRTQHHHKCSYHHDHHSSRKSKRAKRATFPPKFDWRTQNVVTAVKSQGKCGACWAFSSVEVAESMFAISNKTLRAFSVQEMIDCARNSNFGCEGGDICSLLEWLVATKTKILPEKVYPLTRKTDTCYLEKQKEDEGVLISDFTCDKFVGAEDALLATISNHGPVAAAVNALAWQNYLGGVIQYHCDGSFASLNHAVQIVGYDQTASVPYYMVRNSWGPNFGDKGYLYLAIGTNICGIANQVSSLDIIY